MKINKKIIEELVGYLKEFNLSEIMYSEGSTKVKVSRSINNPHILSEETNKKKLTNIYNREEFRSKSLISKAAKGIICGFGVNGYIMALDSIKRILINK